MEIPFDRQIAESYSRGEMFALAYPEWKARFRDCLKISKRWPERGSGAK
jgi:MinD superfamily P-loop ATPase